MSDARFEDGDEQPLRLIAQDGEGLAVIATLLQDAVFPITEMSLVRQKRRFALMLNRFRWEYREAAEKTGRQFERVQSLLVFEDVLAVRSQHIDRTATDTILSLLDISFLPGEDGTGLVTLVLAGGGAIGLQVEALDVTLRDVTRPYLAPSGKVPEHGA
ncbi:MAG: DUF2948 family protein [Cypionkella sp.]|uniref:DUF2948 family protein n=1 Tax=Cypionkella sp. TaxID=2811411 RepID=UPI002ABB22CE|nr:DUF2948 family protein [Cypionkella sp.]MDZ4310679.1 DUF2948 family protein [Cypionkella sp.]MDZ4395423.1 DUF2948 family protein [Cypionkella sp.]